MDSTKQAFSSYQQALHDYQYADNDLHDAAAYALTAAELKWRRAIQQEKEKMFMRGGEVICGQQDGL